MASMNIYQRMKRYIASRGELEYNDYPLNGSGFIRLSERDDDPKIFAIDCEFCTSQTNEYCLVEEVVKITIADHNLQVIYETNVHPQYKVLSHTQQEILSRDGVSLADVHNFLKSNFYSNTIIIGYSLERSFKALNPIHETVVDTSLVYPKRRNGSKDGFNELAKKYLGKSIRCEGYRDTREYATIAMELMLKKI